MLGPRLDSGDESGAGFPDFKEGYIELLVLGFTAMFQLGFRFYKAKLLVCSSSLYQLGCSVRSCTLPVHVVDEES